MKYKILQFLLDHKDDDLDFIDISPLMMELTKNKNLEDAKNLLKEMDIKNKQISVSGNLYQLNSTSAGVTFNFSNVIIRARIRPQGEEDLENYLEKKKPQEPLIKIGHGFTGAVITGTAKDINQDFSKALINPEIQIPNNTPITKAKRTSLLEKLSWTAGIILCLIGLYEFILKRIFHIPLP